MIKRLNANHLKPCACFECDKYPKRRRYTQGEWVETYSNNKLKCKFCGDRARAHSADWISDGLPTRASCAIDVLSSKGINYSIPFDDYTMYSSDIFYMPTE